MQVLRDLSISWLACLQGMMNSLYSQPFAHYNTQPPNLQASQQQPQGQNSQNQKIHYNGWETIGAYYAFGGL